MWQTEMTEMLYIMTGDFERETYSEENLVRLLVVSAQMVATELAFTQDYASDIEALDITPDPCDRDAGTRDDSFINLVCIKAACIINRGDAFKAAGVAMKVRDIGGVSIDNVDKFKAKFALLEKGGWCAVYESEKFDYQMGNVTVAGIAILSPFRTVAGWGNNFADWRG